MHEVYKVVRAESGAQLHADLAKPDIDKEETDLLYAAGKGKISSVLKLLQGKPKTGAGAGSAAYGGGVGSSGGDGSAVAFKVGRKLKRGGAIIDRRKGSAAVSAVGGHDRDSNDLTGVDVNRRRGTRGGATALFLAAQSGYLSIVLALLDAGADPSLGTTNHDTTPILIASSNGYLEVVRALLEAGADPSVATTDGWTPLYVASQKGHLDVVQALLNGGADPAKEKPSNGCTAIYIAAQEGFVGVVKTLIAAGANPTIQRSNMSTPLAAALKQGHLECARVIEAAIATP